MPWNTRAVPVIYVDDAGDQRLRAYQNLKDLQQRTAGCFIAESELVVIRVLDSGWDVQSILLIPSRYARLRDRLDQLPKLDVFVANPAVLDAVVGFPLHRGVLALVARRSLPTIDRLLQTARRVVVLENVVDPDNVGSIFRHAAAFGADAIVLSTHAGDPLYRKAIRTSMSWVLSVPYARVVETDDLVDALRRNGLTSLAFTAAGNVSLRELPVSVREQRVALIVGAEAPGLRPQTIAQSDFTVRIPIDPGIDSLNVASAAAIGLYELFGADPDPRSATRRLSSTRLIDQIT